MNKPQYLIVHHTGGTAANPLADSSNFTFEQCNALHKERFNFISSLGYYVGYHYYISKDGTIKQARLDSDEGAHTIGYNLKSIGICLAGNFDATLPTPAQIRALQGLLVSKSKVYNISKERIVPHRAFAVKTCYGRKLPDDWARKLLENSMFKILLINLDVTDPELKDLPAAVKAEVSRLSTGLFPVEVTIVNHPKDDWRQNLDGTSTTDAVGLTREYLKKVIDEVGMTGYQTTGVIYHWNGISNPAYNIRPRAHGAYKDTQMIEVWMYHREDIKPEPQSPMAGWVWGVVHELCHSVFSRLKDLGISERDTTHDNDPAFFEDEFAIFNKYIPQLTGGVVPQPTPPTEPMIDFRKGDKSGDIFMQAKDGTWRKFLEYEIYETFAKFGKLTEIPQAQMDALPKGMTIAYVKDDLK